MHKALCITLVRQMKIYKRVLCLATVEQLHRLAEGASFMII